MLELTFIVSLWNSIFVFIICPSLSWFWIGHPSGEVGSILLRRSKSELLRSFTIYLPSCTYLYSLSALVLQIHETCFAFNINVGGVGWSIYCVVTWGQDLSLDIPITLAPVLVLQIHQGQVLMCVGGCVLGGVGIVSCGDLEVNWTFHRHPNHPVIPALVLQIYSKYNRQVALLV